MNTTNYNLELSPEQHYKLLQVLTAYIDVLNVGDHTDQDMDQLREVLIDSWKTRFAMMDC
jgi:hypothetical protein